jgi:glutamate synthase (NADPH/NADH) small chain
MAKAGEWLTPERLAASFADVPPPLGPDEALAEAARCLFCFDAPCTRACPTHIDVPKFIRQVLHRDETGAARTILDANIFGGSCARACPTEVLCEGACVDQALVKAPVPIGRLQRYACDTALARGARFFSPGPPTGRKVAVIGSGPAGLSCAHELRRFGHEAVVFEARGVPGGLDTLGIAAYKITTEFALSEIAMIREIGIDLRLNHRVSAEDVVRHLGEYDAVFLGIGLGRTAMLGIEGEHLPGVWEALDFIVQTHTRPFQECEVGRRVLVIGAGNTAVDVATAAKRLGAEAVTIAYRRGESAMPAFSYEYGLAKADGVRFEWHAQPLRVVGRDGKAAGVEFARTESAGSGTRRGEVRPVPGSEFIIEADMVVKALGQEPLLDLLDALPGLKHDRGRVAVDPATGATSVPKLFAGGDCLRNGGEVVDAVRDGKAAARGIHAALGGVLSVPSHPAS